MRKVFFSFNWDDVWRANQVRNSWVTKGNYRLAGFVDSAEIEKVRKSKDQAIKNWIDKQLEETSVTCVLIGSQTADSRWVKYEIQQSRKKKNGLLGVLIHSLKDSNRKIGKRGTNPLENYKSENNSSKNIENALAMGGIGWILAKCIYPQVAILAGFIAAAKPAFALFDDDYKIYNWIEDEGYQNMGEWIEKAARQVGR